MSFNVLFEDAFNESNGNLDSVSPGNWLAGNSLFPAVILSKTCTVKSGNNFFDPEWLAAITPPADQWASITLTGWNLSKSGTSSSIYLRAGTYGAGSISSGYRFAVTANGDGATATILIFEFTTLTTLYHNSSLSVAVGDTFLCSCQGTTIALYHNGNLLTSVTNSTDASGAISLAGNIDSSGGVQTDLGLTNFQMGNFTPPGGTATTDEYTRPRPVQIFGQISSGPNSGEICAVATDSNGNIAVSGGSGGAINTIDILGSIAEAVPCMIFGNLSGATVPGSTQLIACETDNFGNILASIGTGGGNSYPSLDTPVASSTGVTACQVFGRDPAGNIVGVPAATNGALGDTINPITNVPVGYNGIDELTTEDQMPIPVVLCGRIAAGYPNAGAIIAVSLDPTGALCISGSSGSSTTPSAVLNFNNGQPAMIQLYGRTSAGTLTSVPLTAAASLLLN